MIKLTKNNKRILESFDIEKKYSLSEASNLVKDITTTKFNASVDIDVKLCVDPKKADQMVRGIVTLPNGTGKEKKILVLCTPDKENEAIEAGADYYGLDEYVEKIQKGWTDVDVIITMPSVMAKVGKLGKILGPRGLMPNPKSGTVTMEIGKAVQNVKSGKIDFKVDKYGIIHASVGRVAFEPKQIEENTREILKTIIKLKPLSAKGTYIQSIHLSSTMSMGIEIDSKLIEEQ